MTVIKKRNLAAFAFAVLSSICLFVSGTTGVQNWVAIGDIVLRYFNFQIVKIIFVIVLIVASLGGLSVLIGGVLILKKKPLIGNLLIALGAGAGVLGFLLNILISIITLDLSMSSYLSLSSAGIFFALCAQFISGRWGRKIF